MRKGNSLRFISYLLLVILAILLFSGGFSLLSGLFNSMGDGTFTSDKTFNFAVPSDIVIENMRGEMEIEIHDRSNVFIECQNAPNSLRAEIRGGVLKIYFDGFIPNMKDFKIKIFLPKNTSYESVDISGYGDFKVSSLRAKEMKFSLESGKVHFNNTIISKKTEFDLISGESTFENVNFKDALINCNLGKLNFSGVLSGDSICNASFGTATLNLLTNKEFFSIFVENLVSEIEIDGEKIDNHYSFTGKYPAHTLTLSNKFGSIDLNFQI